MKRAVAVIALAILVLAPALPWNFILGNTLFPRLSRDEFVSPLWFLGDAAVGVAGFYLYKKSRSLDGNMRGALFLTAFLLAIVCKSVVRWSIENYMLWGAYFGVFHALVLWPFYIVWGILAFRAGLRRAPTQKRDLA
ncbi:hypothetical protein JT358_16045 [Micrococcales bacterium 31B]|nr:hypothetical protein [Micrococcales bacterium 31B]